MVRDHPADSRDHRREVGRAARTGHLHRHEARARRLTLGKTSRGSAVAGDEAGHEGAMAVVVSGRVGLATQVDTRENPAGEVGKDVNPCVEHPDVHAGPGVTLRPELGCPALLGEDRRRCAAGTW